MQNSTWAPAVSDRIEAIRQAERPLPQSTEAMGFLPFEQSMIVVIVVSRRVGQVTLAVSERTSCRNLNGLKAIVGYRVLRETIVI